jgi:hypothetical protein
MKLMVDKNDKLEGSERDKNVELSDLNKKIKEMEGL